MDTQLSFPTRDELWHMQNDMKSVHATQADHADRIMRLERKLEEDTRVKSVWGTSSPFPGVLGGTSQQDPGYNPAAEAFKSFDQEQNSNLLSGLHIDTEEEPRRGASRANSVRFDESALHGHFGHTSRSSSEFFPIRIGSGLGGVSMVERSSSHKSDGRQSSAGHSAHSTRLNSLAFDSRSPALESTAGVGPPPGLFLLGPLPSIIRCWLDKNFSNEALLYAAVCTGSCTSMISSRLAHRFSSLKKSGDRIFEKVSVRMYLPEATIQQSSSRALDLIPQVPAITIQFEVFEASEDDESLQVIIGSDTLRAKNSELSFSQERMTIFDDEHNKLTIPLVRPENPRSFQNLRTVSSITNLTSFGKSSTGQHAERTLNNVGYSPEVQEHHHAKSKLSLDTSGTREPPNQDQLLTDQDKRPSATNLGRAASGSDEGVLETPTTATRFTDDLISRDIGNGIRSTTPLREKEASMSGPWRRDSSQNPVSDSTFSSIASNSTYQKPGRGKGMKVLKPARSSTSRSISSGQPLSAVEPTPSRWQDLSTRGTLANGTDPTGNQPDSPRRSFSSDTRPSMSAGGGKSRTANPIGGASAFGWLNSGQK